PELCPAHLGVFQRIAKGECYFINGTEWVQYVERYSYNREEILHFDCDVGHFVGFTRFGEKVAGYWNSLPDFMRLKRTAVDWYCRNNYEVAAVFITER
ncbi:HB2D protein, partial [Nesospiza acunhae]|nr:HB2D protein [Nesospiza acunhae]